MLPGAMVRAQSEMRSPAADTGNPPPGPMAFNIPAQPLALALETYSVVAGREIVYNGTLVVDRRSTAVVGLYTPDIALRMLLEGTGLSPRYMAADAFVLEVAPRAVRPKLPANEASPAVVAQYYGRIQSTLKAAFCNDDRTQPGDYRVAVSFWIGATGMVSDVALLGSTGEPVRDAKIDRTLRGLALGAPPPSGFAQPVTLVIAPWSAGMTQDCQAVGGRDREGGATP
jgi:hypothetical protein